MGFLKGSMTFSKYRVTGEVSPDFNQIFDEQIKRYAFPDFIGAASEKSVGWTDIEDPLDTNFAGAKYHVGNYLMFSLRIDRKIMSPALLRLKCLQAEKDYMVKRNMTKIYKKQRDEIKEAARVELLKKIQPIPAFFEVCWHPQEKSLLFSSHSDKVIDDFHRLFLESFQVSFHPFLPWDPQYQNPEFAARLASLKGAPWGREFFTWLWFKSEERNGMINLSPEEDVEIHYVRRIVLASGVGDTSEQVVCQGIRSDLKEGKEALRQGKMIREGRIQLHCDAANWEFTFKADRFLFHSVKLPEAMDMAEEEKDNEGKALERIYLLEQAVKTMERLFSLFLQIRLSSVWETEEKSRMTSWLEK